ncbi:GNAT family N-acetyltransferase [Peredibacter starrii]|uniref:GNAT family N-acetyltransferase n=1 Tax=Peredibacter starrii TaxID=28202 RepID=A0AAX4HTP5_9BACT|nr:GNAT family N-acetyltransferase [Peredibacter starrii]WPU66315.1 GNAT family N-acetyltransferase [Peredibacter starrii]
MNTTGNFHELGPASNLNDVAQMDEKHFPHPWKPLDWKELDFSKHLLYSWSGEKLEAFALFGLVPGDGTAHLYKIQIDPALQGKGVSLPFWSAILENLRQKNVKNIYLEVESSNDRAIGFYKKVGFSCLRRVKGYYSNGSDGLMLQITL